MMKMQVIELTDENRIQGEGYYEYCSTCDACEADVESMQVLILSDYLKTVHCSDCIRDLLKELLYQIS